jgi:DNA-binding NarL/FixJ family response regulator
MTQAILYTDHPSKGRFHEIHETIDGIQLDEILNRRELFRYLEQNGSPDYLLLRFTSDTMNTLDHIKTNLEGTKILVLMKNPQGKELIDIISTGMIHGVLDYDCSPDEIVRSVAILNSRAGVAISPSIAEALFTHFVSHKKHVDNLTVSELKIADLLSKGYSYKKAAEELHLSVNTISFHVKNIYKKMGVDNKAEMIHHLHEAE